MDGRARAFRQARPDSDHRRPRASGCVVPPHHRVVHACRCGPLSVAFEIRDFFDDFAKRIQAGGPEYVYSEEWLGIYWPADEYIFIKLTAEGRMQQFHDECGALLRSLASKEAADIGLLDEALRLHHALVKQPR